MIRTLFSALIALAVFATAVDSAWGQFTYYVGPNGLDGRFNVTARNRDRPWKTLQRAVDAAEPGSTIVVLDGTYWEHAYIQKSGLASRPTLIRAENKHGAFFVGSVGGRSVRHVIIDGLQISNRRTDAPVSKGMYFSYCDNLTIRNNRVLSCRGGGISLDQCDQCLIEWNIAESNAFWDVNQHSGISVYQPQDINRSTARASDVGIHIRNNTSFGNQNLLNNIIWGRPTDGNGIVVDDTKNLTAPLGNRLTYIKKIVVENNLCYLNGGQGIHCYQSENTEIRNNTCYKNMISFEFGGEVSVVSSNRVDVFNNILFAREGRNANLQYQSTNVRWDVNLITNGPSSGVSNGLATVFENPFFVSGSFRLRPESPAINRGTGGLGYSLWDIDGQPRIQYGQIDIGASEFR